MKGVLCEVTVSYNFYRWSNRTCVFADIHCESSDINVLKSYAIILLLNMFLVYGVAAHNVVLLSPSYFYAVIAGVYKAAVSGVVP